MAPGTAMIDLRGSFENCMALDSEETVQDDFDTSRGDVYSLP